MTDCTQLRAAICGLVAFAAEAEAILLAVAAPDGTPGDGPDQWTAPAAVAHNTEFKHQQLQRLQAVLSGTTPPAFGDIDHSSAPVYRRYARQPADAAATGSRRITGELIGALPAIADEDLTDPRRNSWLGGRQLWLQIIVRGFWHPVGHVGEYYLSHDQPERTLALHSRAVEAAAQLAAPAAARGMASYGLACAQARTGRRDSAVVTIRQAVSLNPDLRASAGRDPDLAALREAGRLTALLC
jgi:hypothetical protein